MKWQNKGHEFDTLGAIFKKNKKLLVIGHDESLKSIKEELDFLNTKIEYKTLKEVFSIPILSGLKLKNKTIVIADNSQDTLEKLKRFKFIKHNENLFLADDFLKTYLSIYALYVFNKIYSSSAYSTMITYHCTLNCKYCAAYIPYIKNKYHRNVDEIKKDVDIFFSCFDRVQYFSLTGGEPFLHPNIAELMEYTFKKYESKMKIFQIFTNGSVIFDDNLLKIIKKYNSFIDLILDNYTKNAPHTKKTFDKLVEKLELYNIHFRKTGENELKFFKQFPPKMEYKDISYVELCNKFNLCKKLLDVQEILNGKLYNCCHALNSHVADIIDYKDNNCYDLFLSKNKFELLEFISGYLDDGYLEFCKYCNGVFDMNGGGGI